jgi:hypothetical protein
MSKKVHFMREKDITVVSNNVDIIMDKARNREIQLIEPTLDEFIKVRQIILDFIKKERRIIYGGYAWNNLIKQKEPSDVFYKDTDYTDIEFYSNKPIEDMKNLCDILYAKGFKPIQGKSAQHDETYTIFVNFTGYCDISYMPSNVFYGAMTETVNGYRMIHPKFILVDILRQFNDPMTSFWRLDKNVKRGKIMMKHYPIEFNNKSITIKSTDDIMPLLSSESINLVNFILPLICEMKNILFIGLVGYNVYMNPNINIKTQSITYTNNPLELISVNPSKDVETIYNYIVKYFVDNHKPNDFNDKIIMEQYFPFFQFTDKKVVFKCNGEIFLTIYGNNEKCIPYNDVKLSLNSTKTNNTQLKIKVGTFNVCFMYNLIRFHQNVVEKNNAGANLFDYLMLQMLTKRDDFLNTNDKTILDETIYEDFKVGCLGEPISPMRKFMLSRRDRKLLPRSAIFPYDPEERKDNYATDIYFFNNSSGNIINNPKEFVYNKKDLIQKNKSDTDSDTESDTDSNTDTK